MISEKSSSKTQIIIAIIGLVGVLTAALIANWDNIFSEVTIPVSEASTTDIDPSNGKEEASDLKCSPPWQWDEDLQDCIRNVTIPPKTFSIPLKSAISEVKGSIFFYANLE